MRNILQYANLFGVLALGALCLLQWQADRKLNLSLRHLDQLRQEQSGKILDLQSSLQGVNDDLVQFKESFSEEHAARTNAEQQLSSTERKRRQLIQECDQLKIALTNWLSAVSVRDQRLKEANERIRDLGEKLNASVLRFNELATNYNVAVQRLTDAKKLIESFAPTNAAPAPARQ